MGHSLGMRFWALDSRRLLFLPACAASSGRLSCLLLPCMRSSMVCFISPTFPRRFAHRTAYTTHGGAHPATRLLTHGHPAAGSTARCADKTFSNGSRREPLVAEDYSRASPPPPPAPPPPCPLRAFPYPLPPTLHLISHPTLLAVGMLDTWDVPLVTPPGDAGHAGMPGKVLHPPPTPTTPPAESHLHFCLCWATTLHIFLGFLLSPLHTHHLPRTSTGCCWTDHPSVVLWTFCFTWSFFTLLAPAHHTTSLCLPHPTCTCLPLPATLH